MFGGETYTTAGMTDDIEILVSPTAYMTPSESPMSSCLSFLRKMLKMLLCENPICLSVLQKEAGKS